MGLLIGSGVSVLMILLLLIFRRCGDERQFNPEKTAVARCAQSFDAPMVGSADRADDRQPKARTPLVPGPRFIHSKEPLENARQGFGRNSHSIVSDLEDRLAV